VDAGGRRPDGDEPHGDGEGSMRLVAIARLIALIALVAAILPAGAARASAGMDVGISDDRLLFNDPDHAEEIVQKWQELGVQTARVFARWVAIAPAPDAVHPPDDFRGADPDDPHYDWLALDRVVALLRAHDISPVLAVTGAGPLWSSQLPSLSNPRCKPDPRRFADFAHAVAARYAPQVDQYIVWNEPNQPGWLQPQFTCRAKHCVPASPHVYRALVRASYPAIKAADPSAKVLIGALAPRGGRPTRRNGAMRPLTFIRALGCVDKDYRRIRNGPCSGFRAASADGFAYHPHGVLRAPDEPNPNRDEAAIADLPRLELTLDDTTAAGGLRPASSVRLPLYLTEFSYQTRPPDPYSGVSPSAQARWLQHSAYLAWRDPRVKSMIWYEWRDEPVLSRGLGPKAYSGWQSGLFFADGRAKPARYVFPNPFWVDVKRGAGSARLWGQVRPGGAHTVTILRRSSSGLPWASIATVHTDANGFFTKRVRVSGTAQYRYRYDIPAADPYLQVVKVQSVVLIVKQKTGVVPVAKR
jgi:hypothetical protein